MICLYVSIIRSGRCGYAHVYELSDNTQELNSVRSHRYACSLPCTYVQVASWPDYEKIVKHTQEVQQPVGPLCLSCCDISMGFPLMTIPAFSVRKVSFFD